jgi:hypothetical protein
MCCNGWTDVACRGDETLEPEKGHGRDRAWQRMGARRGWRHGEGRSAAGLTPGAQPGWGSSRGWSDAITGAGSVMGGRTRFAGAGSGRTSRP